MPDSTPSFFGSMYNALFGQPKVDYQKLQQQMYQGAVDGSNPVKTDQLQGDWFTNTTGPAYMAQLLGKGIKIDPYKDLPRAGIYDSPVGESLMEYRNTFPEMKPTYGAGKNRIATTDPITDLLMRNGPER